MSNDNQLESFKRIKDNIYGKIKNHQQKRIIDCFDEEFRFIRRFDEYKFSKKMTRLGITHLVLDDEYDLTDILEADIVNPIRYGSNMTFGIKGYTGTGKSETAKKIALLSKKANKKYKNRDTNGLYGFYLNWDKNDFEETLKVLKKGDVVLKDEMPRHMGKGRLRQKWSIENVLDTVRMMENTFIFVDPKNINMECDILLESAGMDKKERINRFMILDEEEYYYGHVYIKLHDDDELRTWYKKEKKKFINRNLKIGGKFKVNVIDAEFNETDKKDKDKLINNIVHILKNTIRDTKKNKMRNIFIWEHHMKDEDKYSFEALADAFKLSSDTIEGIFYNLNKKINNYSIVVNLKLMFF